MAEPTAVKKSVESWLTDEKFRTAVAEVLPRHMTADRFFRIAAAAQRKTPDLAKCAPVSVINCLQDLSAMGLEPDGRLAHLIPYKRKKQINGRWEEWYECQLIVDYKGLAELAYRSGQLARTPRAEVVCMNDEFEWADGVVHHRIDYRKDRGEMFAAYSCVRLKDSDVDDFCVMTKKEIDGIRARSRARDNGPWVTDYNEMAKKTCFRRQSKWLPRMGAEFYEAMERDYDALAEELREAIAEARKPAAPLFRSLPQSTTEPLDIPTDTAETVPVETQDEADERQLKEQLAREGLFPDADKGGGKK